MGLSVEFVDDHIREWTERLKGRAYPHRQKWPRHLFHHAELENATRILESGKLLSRTDSHAIRARDVAAPDVIEQSQRAHKFARLYFRPRTPTQFHIEGIRRRGECQYGENAHAPVLVMFVFDANRVLSLDEIFFSDRNMQSGAAEMFTEAQFRTIPFEKVYHEGGTAGDRSITSHRCAEVLAPSPMALGGTLRAVYCRSGAERATLLHLLGGSGRQWERFIRVSDDLKVFEKRFAFVEALTLATDGVTFRLNPRYDRQTVRILLEVRDSDGQLCLRVENDKLAAAPANASSWHARARLNPGLYRVSVTLEDHRAYVADLRLDDVPF